MKEKDFYNIIVPYQYILYGTNRQYFVQRKDNKQRI